MTDPQLLRPDARYESIVPAVKRMPRSAFWAAWLRSAVWHGTGYLLFMEDANGAPVPGTLQILNPSMVSSRRNGAGELVWTVGDAADPGDNAWTDRNGYLLLPGPPLRIVALRDPHAPVDEDGRSIGLIERNRSTFRVGHDIENYTAGVYRSGVPSGYIKTSVPDLTPGEAEDLRERWAAAHGGSRRSIAVLNSTTEFKPIQFSPVDLALVEGKRANLADMAMAFGLDPAGSLGVTMGASMTYQNAQQQFARLRQDLLPWITAVEQTIGALLPTGRDMRIDFSELTRPDPTQQYAVLNTAVASGLLTSDEARGQIGLPPLGAQQARPPVAPNEQDPQEEITDGTS
jgi:phage portal protein BeeE